MEHSPSWEADRSSASQIPHILRNPHVHYRIHKRQPFPRPRKMFPKIVRFYGEELLSPHPTLNLSDDPLSPVRILFNIFAATILAWRS